MGAELGCMDGGRHGVGGQLGMCGWQREGGWEAWVGAGVVGGGRDMSARVAVVACGGWQRWQVDGSSGGT